MRHAVGHGGIVIEIQVDLRAGKRSKGRDIAERDHALLGQSENASNSGQR
jgi:hypothetical protein